MLKLVSVLGVFNCCPKIPELRWKPFLDKQKQSKDEQKRKKEIQ